VSLFLDVKFLWPSLVLENVTRENIELLLICLELLVAKAEKALLHRIYALFHHLSHQMSMMTMQRLFWRLLKILLRIQNLINVLWD